MLPSLTSARLVLLLAPRRRARNGGRTGLSPLRITNGEVKLEAVDGLGVPPPPAEVKDEFAEQVLVVDYDEEEKDDGGVNEDLRVVIKVIYFILHCRLFNMDKVLTLAH
jgi:hypothetical protein